MGSSYAQQITPEDSRVVTGSNLSNYTESGGIGANASYQEAGSVSAGGNIDTGTRITGNTGTVTIGETGTANTFADAVTKLFESNAEQTSKLFEQINPAAGPAPAQEEGNTIDLAGLWIQIKQPLTLAALAGVALVALLVWRPWKQRP